MITLPTNLTLADWADQMALDLDATGPISRLSGDKWQDWGMQIFNNRTLGGALPNPYGFTDWREWAERLCGVLT